MNIFSKKRDLVFDQVLILLDEKYSFSHQGYLFSFAKERQLIKRFFINV